MNTSTARRKIILVHPVTGFWDGFRSAPALPLNLLHAASLADGEFDLELIDLRVHFDWKERLRRAIAARPALVGVSTMIGPATISSIRIARTVKAMSGVPVALGGVHASLACRSALEEGSIDYTILGEGELPLLRLARSLAEGAKPAFIPGVRSKFDLSAPVSASEFAERIDLDDCPEIPYHSVLAETYLQYFDGVADYISMETSRGCPHSCGYCYHSRAEYSGWRSQSPERVVERARFVKERLGAGGVYFVDDNFFIDPRRAESIAEGMAELDLSWQVQGVDIAALKSMDNDYISLLASCGLKRITVGVDSGSDRIRAKLGKQLASSEAVETIRRMRAFPIIVYCSFIVNFPGETAKDVRSTVRMIAELSDCNPNFRNSPVYQYVPFPGTRIASELESSMFEWPENFADWGRISFESGYGADNSGLGRAFYSALYFVTMFSDGKFEEYLDSPLLKFLSRLYSPIALFRLKKLFFKPIPEMRLFLAVKRFLMFLRSQRRRLT